MNAVNRLSNASIAGKNKLPILAQQYLPSIVVAQSS
jgi:hypothetical protein